MVVSSYGIRSLSKKEHYINNKDFLDTLENYFALFNEKQRRMELQREY